MADDVAATFGPEPMATLTATPDELTLSGTRGTYRVPRASVTKIGRGKMYPWFFAGLRIHHTNAKLPTELQFKPFGVKPAVIAEALRSLGYSGA